MQLGFVEETPAKSNKPTRRTFQEGQRAADPRQARSRSSPRGAEKPKVGDQVLASIFANGERVDIVGTGRGKGFQGVVKRHHFAGGAATHGSMFHRAPGSIGASSFPSRVVKGMRAAGRMGGKRDHDSQPESAARRSGEPSPDRRRRHPGRAESYVIIRKAVTLKKLKVAQVEKPKKGKK